MITTSQLKITHPFNKCPGGEPLTRALERNSLDRYASYIDIVELPFWQNDKDTAIIGFNMNGASDGFRDYVTTVMVDISTDLNADEIQWEQNSEYLVTRLWWD